MAAPTEAEIRAAIGDLSAILAAMDVPKEIHAALDPVNDSDLALVRAGWVDDFYPRDDHPGTLWADMRASEVEELHAITNDIVQDELRQAGARMRERLLAELVRFSVQHPDIPRGQWPNGVPDPNGDRKAVAA